jgi:hypothetical protein
MSEVIMNDTPAFPQERTLGDGSHEECEGLTIRDYFAAKAMPVILQHLLVQGEKEPILMSVVIDNSVDFAFKIADSMLEERLQ